MRSSHLYARLALLALVGSSCSSNGSDGAGGSHAESSGESQTGGSSGSVSTTKNAGGTQNSGGATSSGGVSKSPSSSAQAGQTAAGGKSSAADSTAAGGQSTVQTSTGVPGGTMGTGGRTGGNAGGKASGGETTSTGGKTSGGGTTAITSGPSSPDAGAAGTGGSSPSAGCGSANTTSPCSKSGSKCTLNVNGTDRTFYVQLPSTYDPNKPYPVFFQFHPWGGSAEGSLTMYKLNSQIPNAIYVSPQGLQAGTGGPGWANSNGEDIAFTKAMLADLQAKYCVDSTRVFSTGFSYGGMMSFAIGCEMNGLFRAIAPMAGSLYSDPSCAGTGHAVAMWGSHGTSDNVVPLADGRAARDKILKQNHCGTQTTPVDPSPCVKYQGCDAGYDVTWCEWDGKHGMPSFGSSASAAFFKQFL